MTNLIGLTGNMGCGKSEAFKAIKEQANGRTVVLVKFAQPLYDMQEYIYNRISSVHTRPPEFIKDRKLLQWLGTEWGRDSISTNLWANIFKAEAESQIAAGRLVVCDDVRFDNEGALVKSMGGTIMRITSNRNGERIDLNAGIKNHASEAGLAHEFIDVIVENNGTLKEYQDSLAYILNRIGISECTPAEYTESA